MNTQCTPTQLQFHSFGRRGVVARLDAGHLSSDGGALLLREADRRLDLARNDRLVRRIDKSRRRHAATGKASRRFREFRYRTRPAATPNSRSPEPAAPPAASLRHESR